MNRRRFAQVINYWLETKRGEVIYPEDIVLALGFDDPATKKALYNRLDYLSRKKQPTLVKQGSGWHSYLVL